ncbi:MAG: SgcJ/EcaC family oxidoreductase [Chloroflexota bacterium]
MSTTPTTHTMQDEAAIGQLLKDVETAWNNADGSAFARVFAEDSEFRSLWGDKAHGRDAIAQAHQHLFTGPLRGSSLEVEIEGIRFVRPDVAYVEMISRMKHPSNPFPYSIACLTVVKTNGEWRAVTFNNAGILPRPERRD